MKANNSKDVRYAGRWLTAFEVAEHFGISRRSLDRMIADGTVPRPPKVRPGAVRFPPALVAEVERKLMGLNDA